MLKFSFSRFRSFLINEVFTKRFVVVSIYLGLWSYCLARQKNFDLVLLMMFVGIAFLLVIIEPFLFDDLKKKHIDVLPSNDRRRSDREYDLSKTRLIISFTFVSIFLSLIIFMHALYTDSRKNLGNESFHKNNVENLGRKSPNAEKDNNENMRSH